jgi:hypothetical protein
MLADAVEHATVSVSGGDLVITAPKSFSLYFKDPAFDEAVREVFGRSLRLKLIQGESSAAPMEKPMAPPSQQQEDEASNRALSNPEVQRFRDVFGGEVRKVRNLKE